MTAKIIDGKNVAADMREELKQRVSELKTQAIVPGLCVILVGEDPASKSYVTANILMTTACPPIPPRRICSL